MNETKTTTKTRTIAGRTITLAAGQRYLATRPIARRGRTTYPITIRRITDGWSDDVVLELPGMTYDEANDFLEAFNNGPTSFDGRVW